MKIEEYIRSRFESRLEDAPALVVYDPDRRYQEIVLSMAGERVSVVDGTGPLIEGREQAMERWLALAGEPEHRLVIYVPFEKPVRRDLRLQDPYLIFQAGGAVFPDGLDDEYPSLCKQAFPLHVDRIDELFSAGVPDFATVNALEGGATWPILRTGLKAESPTEIVTALLAPSPAQKTFMESGTAWLQEAGEFLKAALGLNLAPDAAGWNGIASIAWRFVLFSELAHDLPGELPGELRDVPCAEARHRELIHRICNRLRSSSETKEPYIETAEGIEQDLRLAERLSRVTDLGVIETFPFENVVAFRGFCASFSRGELARAEEIHTANKGSIWRQAGGRHQAIWRLAEIGLELTGEADAAERELGRGAITRLQDLVDLYARHFHRIDAAFRRFHQARAAIVEEDFFGVPLEPIARQVNDRYRGFSGKLHALFLEAVEREGWPAGGFPPQGEIFARFVQPLIGESRKVAFLMIDALRYELAMELEQSLGPDFTVSVEPACAQLPTKTEVGMAALLPKPDGRLSIGTEGGSLQARIGGTDVSTSVKRDEYLASTYGDRCKVTTLDGVQKLSRKKLSDKVTLIVVRSREIDEAGETSAGLLPIAVPGLLALIQKCIHQLRQLGFEQVIVASDHGFLFLPDFQPGDSTARPGGDWKVAKERFLLGKGSASAGTARFAVQEVGIPADAESYVVPRGLSAFTAGVEYTHGGLSLQECVVPVLTVRSKAAAGRKKPKITLSMTYRGKTSGAVTSRMVMVELACHSDAPPLGFGEEWAAERLEAQLTVQREGTAEEVGRVAPSDFVDPTTLRVRIPAGAAIKVPIRIADGFHGRFTVKALDPVTMACQADLTLETNFME